MSAGEWGSPARPPTKYSFPYMPGNTQNLVMAAGERGSPAHPPTKYGFLVNSGNTQKLVMQTDERGSPAHAPTKNSFPDKTGNTRASSPSAADGGLKLPLVGWETRESRTKPERLAPHHACVGGCALLPLPAQERPSGQTNPEIFRLLLLARGHAGLEWGRAVRPCSHLHTGRMAVPV